VQGYNTRRCRTSLSMIVGQQVTQSREYNSSWCRWWRRSKNSRDKNRKKLGRQWILLGGEPEVLNKRKIEGFVATKKSRNTVSAGNPAKPGPYRKGPAVWSNGTKLQTQVGQRLCDTEISLSSRYSGRSNRRAIPTVPLTRVGKVRGEWALICMTHNILKFTRSLQWISATISGQGSEAVPEAIWKTK